MTIGALILFVHKFHNSCSLQVYSWWLLLQFTKIGELFCTYCTFGVKELS